MNVRVTEVGVRIGVVAFLYFLWTLVLWLNIPDVGETATGAFGGFALVWVLVTVCGGLAGLGVVCNAFWQNTDRIADWINERLS